MGPGITQPGTTGDSWQVGGIHPIGMFSCLFLVPSTISLEHPIFPFDLIFLNFSCCFQNKNAKE